MIIRLPFPSRTLSPNHRGGWYTSHAERVAARTVGCAEAAILEVDLSDKPLTLSLEFHAPDRKRRDLDNALAAMKPYLDGVFMGIKSDDSQVKKIILSWGVVDVWRKGFVDVRIVEYLEEK